MKKNNIIFQLLLNNFFKDILGLFLGFILPLFTLVCWLILKTETPFIFISAVSISIIRNGLANVSRTMAEFKSTKFLDKIIELKINLWWFLCLNSIFSLIVNFIAFVWLLIPTILISNYQLQALNNVNWLVVILGLILLVILCNLIGILIGTLITNAMVVSALGTSFYILSMYLLGLAYPLEEIMKHKVLVMISYIIPLKCIINVIQCGWVNQLSMNFVINGNTIDFNFSSIYIPIVITIILVLILSILIWIIFTRMLSNKRLN